MLWMLRFVSWVPFVLFCYHLQEQLKDEYIAQMIPGTQPLSRIKLKVFGHSGVGKTTLLESLKCGYFSSWFRRSKTSPTSPKPKSSMSIHSHPLSFPSCTFLLLLCITSLAPCNWNIAGLSHLETVYQHVRKPYSDVSLVWTLPFPPKGILNVSCSIIARRKCAYIYPVCSLNCCPSGVYPY